MERYDIKQQKNFHDYFIIFIVAAAIVGTAQMGLLSLTLCAGLLCLPAAMKEIYISIKEKAQPIIAFMILFLLYTVVSVAWAPRHENLLRELWNISWNIIIFIGLFNHSRYAVSAKNSFLTGLRLLICFSLIIATWEIVTDSHIPGFGDFNEGAQIATKSGSEHRIFAAVTYRNLNSYVTLLCMALPFLTYSLFVLQRKWLSLVAIIGSIIVLIINSSRGGLMCLAIDILIFVFIYRKFQFVNKKLITILTGIILTFIIIRYGLVIAEQAIGRLSAYGKENMFSDAGRWDVWRMGIDFCISSWGFGHGVGSMQPMYATTGFWLHHSHNFVVEFLIQYGFWLFILFGILLLKNWLQLTQEKDNSSKMLGLMLLISFIPLAIIDDTYLTRTCFWIWLVMQFVVTQKIKQS